MSKVNNVKIPTPVLPTPPDKPIDGKPENKDAARARQVRPCLLFYWIPKDENGNDVYPNPAHQLRRRAVWLDGSVWAIPEDNIPYSLIDGLSKAGCTVHVIPQDLSEAEKVFVMIRQSIAKKAQEALNRAADSAEGIDEAREDETTSDIIKREQSRTRIAIRRVEKYLEDLEAGARAFGLGGAKGWAARRAAARIQIIKDRTAARCAAYKAAAERLKDHDPAFAKLASADEVPAGILLDRLEDLGLDTADLRGAFSRG